MDNKEHATAGILNFVHERFVIIGVFLGICSCVLESIIHSCFFSTQYPVVITEVFFPGAHEIWMRLIIVILFVAFGDYAQWITAAVRKAERETQMANMELTQIFVEMTTKKNRQYFYKIWTSPNRCDTGKSSRCN